jgi:hypothetical protein
MTAGARPGGDAGYTGRWQPSAVSAPAASFARQVVLLAGPAGRDRAKNLLWAAGKLADWAIPLRLEPVPAVLLHPSVIERCAPRSALLYRPRSGRGLEEVSVGLMADPDP